MPAYSISNNSISITVNSLGAELVSLKKSNTEILWQADKSIWNRSAPVLFPVVGKLKDNRFIYNNASFHMPQHGFARDEEFVLIGKENNVLEFELTASEHTLSLFPFHFSLRIRYELNANSLNIKYLVFNPESKSMWFSIGAHPGFNCKRVTEESLNDYYLEFDNKKEITFEKLDNGLLSGQTSVLKLENSRLRLSRELFDNDALVLKNNQVEKVTLSSSKSKERIILNCKDWPYFGIWCKTCCDAFVCLEPWYGIADSVNSNHQLSGKEGIIELQPYSTFTSVFSIEIANS